MKAVDVYNVNNNGKIMEAMAGVKHKKIDNKLEARYKKCIVVPN